MYEEKKHNKHWYNSPAFNTTQSSYFVLKVQVHVHVSRVLVSQCAEVHVRHVLAASDEDFFVA